jgi:phage baseplate assembly protein W
MKSISPKFPLMFDSALGDYSANLITSAAIKQNFKNLLLTNKGERVMDTNFGVGLRSYFFEPMIQRTYSDISNNIKTQVKRYMPFITIKEVNFQGGSAGSDNLLGVAITYVIVPLAEVQTVQIQSTAQNYL